VWIQNQKKNQKIKIKKKKTKKKKKKNPLPKNTSKLGPEVATTGNIAQYIAH